MRRHRSTRRSRLRRRPCRQCGLLTWSVAVGETCSECATPAVSLTLSTESARFPLAESSHRRPDPAPPSPRSVRPWGMRDLHPAASPGATSVGWYYDPVRQLTVDAAGSAVVSPSPLGTVRAATANSVSSGDGDEGPSEDWTYDFCPDLDAAAGW